MTATRLEADAERFAFGENWYRFLSVLDEGRIEAAGRSLSQMLGVTTLAGQRFLDAGSGSGLFSLCARRLDASGVVSFDYDARSVACTEELKRRFYPRDARWRVEQGSVLDAAYLESLGKFDVVYSWGVLHHTGNMWTALDLVSQRVAPGGCLFVSIYNDQGRKSRQWAFLKRSYNRWPWARPFVVLWTFLDCWGRTLIKDALTGNPLRMWTQRRGRGMSPWHDLIDWAGGYPFEVAKPEQIFRFYRDRGFRLTEMKTDGGGLGCNEFVFRKD